MRRVIWESDGVARFVASCFSFAGGSRCASEVAARERDLYAFSVNRSRSYALIGAGVSGLTAARALTDIRRGVVVFDKGRAPGGRISSRQTRSSSNTYDHGAQYFTARDPEFVRTVEGWRQRGTVAEWKPRVGVREGGRLFAKPSSPPDLQRYVGVPLMAALAGELRKDLDVRSGVHVRSLEVDGAGVRLRDEAGDDLGTFDAVGVTTPTPQAAELLQPIDAVLSERLRQTRWAPTWAVMLAFETRLPLAFDAVFVNEGPLSWVARDSSKPGRPKGERFVLHAHPDWSRDHLELSAPEAMPLLERSFFETLELEAVSPNDRSAHRWRFARPCEPLVETPWVSEVAPVALAGDWGVAPRVEGAWRAGRVLAELLMNRG